MYESIKLWALNVWIGVEVTCAMWQEAVNDLLGDDNDNWPQGGAPA